MQLFLTGHISENGKSPWLQRLLPLAVKRLADEVRSGSFIIPSRFFIPDYTGYVNGYTLNLDELDPINPIAPSQPTSAIQTYLRNTSVAKHPGPHIPPHYSSKSVDGITDIRKVGYSNFRGVSRDPS